MSIRQGLNSFLSTLLKIWNAIFYAFSACTLYATIVLCLKFGLKWCGVSESTINLTITCFTGFVLLYIIAKIIAFLVTWPKKRRKAKEAALNATLENDEVPIATSSPSVTSKKIAEIPTTQGEQQLTNPRPSLASWLASRKKRPPIQPQKA